MRVVRVVIDRLGPYTISLFYFVLGFVFIFPSVNIWLFLQEKTGLDPGKLAMEMQVVDIPWLLKPLYAWMSDRYPIAGYRRKSYVIMFSTLCSIMWMIMPMSMNHIWMFYLFWTLENLFLCVSDVVVDALLVERVQELEKDVNTRGKLQSACTTCRSLGKCVGALAGAFMFATGANRQEIFYVTGLAPLSVATFGFYIAEKRAKTDDERLLQMMDSGFEENLRPRSNNARNWKYYIRNMLDGFLKTNMWKFCLVATCYTMAPDASNGYFFYFQHTLKVSDFSLQMTRFAHEFGLLAGTVIYGLYLRTIPARPLMIFSTLLVVCMIMSHAVVIFMLPLDTSWRMLYVYFYEAVTAMADVFLFMPLTIMATRLCTEGVEGTSYSLVVSIENLGSFMDSFLSSQMMNILGITSGELHRLWYMSFMCAFWFLVPLPLLQMLPDRINTSLLNKGE